MTFPPEQPVFSIDSTEQTIIEIVFGLVALAALAYCVVVARREHKIWPLAVFGGAMLALPYEAVCDLLGNVAYPTEASQHEILDVLGQPLPLYVWFIYSFYLSAPVVWLMKRFEAGITGRQLATYFSVGVVAAACFEPLITANKWWFYFDYQPLSFTGMPMWWWFVNPTCVFGIAAVLYLVRKYALRRDLESLIFVPLVGLALFAIHGSAGFPQYLTINQSSHALAILGTFGSIAVSISYIWLIGRLVTVREPAVAPAPEPVERAKPVPSQTPATPAGV
jgi:hypothetical protein